MRNANRPIMQCTLCLLGRRPHALLFGRERSSAHIRPNIVYMKIALLFQTVAYFQRKFHLSEFSAYPDSSPPQLIRIIEVLLYLVLLTYSTEQSPSSEANPFSVSPEIPCTLWDPKVHYSIQKFLPSVPILSQLDPSTPSYPTS